MTERKITTNMTEGAPLGHIMRFAVPLLVGNVFQQIYSLVDTVIAGHFLGADAIAAIGATSMLYSLLINIAWGLNNGYCIILSNAFGAGDRPRFRNCVAIMIELSIAVSLLLTAFAARFLRPILLLLSTPSDIFDAAHTYIFIVMMGLAATVAYNAASGYMRALGNSRTPLYFLIMSSMLNLALDVLFMVVLHLGIAGAAYATVVSQVVSAVACVIYIMRNYGDFLPRKSDMKPRGRNTADMLTTGLSMALMSSVFSLGSVILQRAINELGTLVLTAHTAARRVYDVMMIPMFSVASANSTFVGQNYGAGKMKRIVEANRKVLLVELAWALVCLVVPYTIGHWLIVALTGIDDGEMLGYALMNMRWCTACFFPLGALLVLRNAMQSMGHRVLPVLSSCIELGGKVVSAAVIVPLMGYRGVALTEPVIWCLCAAFLSCFYVTIGHQKKGLE